MALAKKKVYSFSCPPELYARATALCKTRGCTKSWLVAKGLERILDEEEEDARDYEAAAAAWKEFEASGEKGYTAEEARKKLDL